MPSPTDTGVTPAVLFRLLVDNRRLWITPMVAVAIVAALLTLVVPRKWKATQGVMIRSQAAGLGSERLGKFSDLSEMKTLQETLLEVARSNSVVTTALEKVGRRPSWFPPREWPTAQDVEDFRDSMVMTPPGGAEFGKTEVFYLAVLDKDPKRAAALVDSLCDALEARTQDILEHRASSMIAELTEGMEQAEQQLAAKTSELGGFEARVGANLSDLRSLVNPIGGVSETAQDILAIQAEMRLNDTERRRNEKLWEVLEQAQQDPQKLIATPSALLTSQPGVARLKQGLIDAQLTTARLLGKLAPAHPFIRAAQESELQVRQQLHNELAIAMQGVEIELALSDQRQQALGARLAANEDQQRELARHRAAYSQLVAAVDHQTMLVDSARTRLANVQVQEAGAQSASVLSRIDDVESSLRPVGPRRAMVIAAGGLAGLIMGLGLVFLLHGPAPLSTADLERQEWAYAADRPSVQRANGVAVHKTFADTFEGIGSFFRNEAPDR